MKNNSINWQHHAREWHGRFDSTPARTIAKVIIGKAEFDLRIEGVYSKGEAHAELHISRSVDGKTESVLCARCYGEGIVKHTAFAKQVAAAFINGAPLEAKGYNGDDDDCWIPTRDFYADEDIVI